LKPLWRAIRDIFHRLTKGTSTGHVGYVFGDILQDDLSNKSCILLCMGLDQGDGRITLDRNGNANLDWPYKNSMRLYNGILSIGKRFKRIIKAKFFVPLPTWNWPFRKNVCVHALGGCAIGDSAEGAVTSASPETFGEVFNYKNLFVADGSILPGPVGANPSATIAALAERVGEGITGERPDDEL
jgi:cholesterol oxidase